MISIDFQDLADAYRKVKVDLFYSGNPCRQKLADFEDHLQENFETIENALRKRDSTYLLKISEGYWLCPKKIEFKNKDSSSDTVCSDLDEEYSPDKATKTVLRIIENLPVAFHVITTLWINKIGEQFDSILSENAYGNRIRRHNGNPNLKALGTFNHYLHYYQVWRDNGLKKIRTALEQEKRVIAITGDFTAFYHNIDASFIISDQFLGQSGISLKNEEKEFTELIVEMLNHWAEHTPLGHGLPVGCSISAVIANAALFLFDKQIEDKLQPLYYGRYVDDFILVIENISKFSNLTEALKWILVQVPSLSKESESSNESNNLRISFNLNKQLEIPNEKSKTNLYFEKNKTKLFLLNPPSGLAFLNSLAYQIKEQSSEWRSLPELPDDKYIASMLLSACNKTGEEADNLRKADSLSTRRAMFAIKLRDFESYSRNLPSDCWVKQRRAFLDTIYLYFTNINSFFDLYKYFPRILSIAAENGDFDYLFSIIEKIKINCRKLRSVPLSIADKIFPEKFDFIDQLEDYICTLFSESILSSLTPRMQKKISSDKDILHNTLKYDFQTISEVHYKFFCYDLANKPFRYCFLYREEDYAQMNSNNKFFYTEKEYHEIFPKKKHILAILSFQKEVSEFDLLKKLTTSNNTRKFESEGVPKAWFFPTRPFSMPELYLCLDDAFNDNSAIAQLLCFFRGFPVDNKMMPSINNTDSDPRICTIQNTTMMARMKADEDSDPRICTIQNTPNASTISVAIASWKTIDNSYSASINQENEPDLSRFRRFSHLLNNILRSLEKIDYVVFPELSVPSKWFLGVANKLINKGISLIAGVDYLHDEIDGQAIVHNQVWCSLLYDKLGFAQSVIVRHDKDIPAIHEEEELKNAHVKLEAENRGQSCNIIQHGNFFFGILICSELTNIDYRAKLRGQVDAIFVPEWNSDIEMFSSLIEAAAYDVHAYIVQCNNRQYGDTRIRIPAKVHYNRDIVRIKGGEEDFFVVGKLDIKGLREFQSHPCSPTGKGVLFKPVPAGFAIAPYRKILHIGDGTMISQPIVIKLNSTVSLKLVKVEAGSFTMSANDGENYVDESEHPTTLTKDFYLGKTVVTQAQWQAVMGTTIEQQRDEEDPNYPLAGTGANYPMYYVCWHEAIDFCEKLNEQGKAPAGYHFTLPMETQWEYAAKGGKKSKGYKYSGSNTIEDVAWYYGNSGYETHEVGKKTPNELELYDMSGNVWEWCLDNYKRDSSQAKPEFTPRGKDSDSSPRVCRGGSWSYYAGYCRVANRDGGVPGDRGDSVGFRVVLSAVQ